MMRAQRWAKAYLTRECVDNGRRKNLSYAEENIRWKVEM